MASSFRFYQRKLLLQVCHMFVNENIILDVYGIMLPKMNLYGDDQNAKVSLHFINFSFNAYKHGLAFVF